MLVPLNAKWLGYAGKTGKPNEKTMKETQALGYILENYAEPAVYIIQRVLRNMKVLNEMWEMCQILLPECHSTQVKWCCNKCMYCFIHLNNTARLLF